MLQLFVANGYFCLLDYNYKLVIINTNSKLLVYSRRQLVTVTCKCKSLLLYLLMFMPHHVTMLLIHHVFVSCMPTYLHLSCSSYSDE